MSTWIPSQRLWQAQQQVLVLLPEIVLTEQWLQRFKKRFGAMPHQWHSRITNSQRRTTWHAVLDGSAQVIVGARSALFLPWAHLGLLIVDEEHESAFKQEEGGFTMGAIWLRHARTLVASPSFWHPQRLP